MSTSYEAYLIDEDLTNAIVAIVQGAENDEDFSGMHTQALQNK